MVFKNIRPYFLGSDDFPAEAKVATRRDLNEAQQAGWPGFEIRERIPLAEIARAHELADCRHGVKWIRRSNEGNRPLP